MAVVISSRWHVKEGEQEAAVAEAAGDPRAAWRELSPGVVMLQVHRDPEDAQRLLLLRAVRR